MKLSALIQKNRIQHIANANPANVAKDGGNGGPALARLATLALANPPEPKTPLAANDTPAPLIDIQTFACDIAVTAYTPLGAGIIVQARDAEHAAQIRRWNPKPAPTAPRSAPSIPDSVRCSDCRHALATNHEVMVDCGKSRQAPGSCGYWHRLVAHSCAEFDAAKTEETP